MGMEYLNWQGESKDQDWKVVFIKNEDVLNEYSGNLYWIGDIDKVDSIYVELLIVKKDDEILLSFDIEIFI